MASDRPGSAFGLGPDRGSLARGDQIGPRQDHQVRPPQGARRLAQRQISLESIVQRHESRWQDAGKSGDPVPVILITYATTEDAVRRALAAVKRDGVISGAPQGRRLELL